MSIFETLFVLPRFWDTATCTRLREAMDRGCASAAEIVDDGFRIAHDVRRTFDVEVDTATVGRVVRDFAAVRPAVSSFFRTPLAAAEGPGFLRYPSGGFFRAHRDLLDEASDDFPRTISLVAFLTSAERQSRPGCCEGGYLRLYLDPSGEANEAHDIVPAAGTLVAFPSWLLHEVLPVTAGVRDVIVDWFY